MKSAPLVDVALVTYNHEKYIAQAINSVLAQETDFEYRLIIGDDCSTDNTQAIVKSFAELWPERIVTLFEPKNLGILHPDRVGLKLLKLCTAKYVALLDGDDYWTSKQKLQKQVAFLNSHPDCTICFHPIRWFYEDERTAQPGWHNTVWPSSFREFSTMEDILKEMFIQTGSVVYRNGVIADYPAWFTQLPMGDWILCALLADKGRIGCLNEVMSAYRRHVESIWFAVEDEARSQLVIKMYEFLNAHFDYRYAHIIRPLLADYYLRLAVLYDQRGSYEMARPSVAKSVAAQLRSWTMPPLNSLKMLARLSFPSLYSLSKRLFKKAVAQ